LATKESEHRDAHVRQVESALPALADLRELDTLIGDQTL
jgi:hypothetical protein